MGGLLEVVRPERFERPTLWFVARYSIQLSYGRILQIKFLAETKGFEPLIQITPYVALAGL